MGLTSPSLLVLFFVFDLYSLATILCALAVREGQLS